MDGSISRAISVDKKQLYLSIISRAVFVFLRFSILTKLRRAMGPGIKFCLLKLAELITSMRIFLSRCIRARGYLAPGFLQCRASRRLDQLPSSRFRMGSVTVSKIQICARFVARPRGTHLPTQYPEYNIPEILGCAGIFFDVNFRALNHVA
jgi:hypothetical protein